MELRNRDPILNISSFSSAQLHMQSYHKHGVVDWLLWRFNKKIPSLPIVKLGFIVGFFFIVRVFLGYHQSFTVDWVVVPYFWHVSLLNANANIE